MSTHDKRETKVLTVKLSAVNRDAMHRWLREFGIPSDNGTGPPLKDSELVSRIINHFKKRMASGDLPSENVLQCDVCGGYSDIGMSECPYCGMIDAENPDGETTHFVDSVDESQKESAVQIVKPEDSSADKSQGEPDSLKKSKRTGKKQNTAIEKKEADVVYSVENLDAEIAHLRSAAVATAKGLYSYGKALERIRSLELWKLRGTHKSFEQFCKAEVNVSRAHAYRILAVVANYTEPQLEKYGLWKLNLALDVPEELRSKLLGDGSETRGEIGERAKSLMNKESKARKTLPVDRSKAVSVAIVPGIVEIPMQKRPTADDWPVGKLTEPAKSLSDDPWFRLGLTNNVFLSVRLTRNDAGEIIAIVEHRRGENVA